MHEPNTCLPARTPFICKPNNPEPITPTTPPLSGSYTPGHYFPAQITPEPGYQTNKDNPYDSEPTEIIQTNQS